MQFPSSIVLVCVSLQCYVTCVFELHATFVWAPPSSSNFARNSPGTTSNRELTSLQLRRLWAVSKSDRGKLCVSFAWLAPVTARRLRGKALRALRRPPHRRRCVADVWLGASSWSPPWPRRPPILLRQFRMQFPFRYFKVCIHVVGIATFLGFVESSFNRIACEIWRGARCWGAVGCWCAKLFALLVVLVAEAVQSSPCMRKVGRNRRFGACWESFVPGGPPSRARWESFVPEVAPHAG